MIKVSIITVNKNNADGLRRTIESVIGQTFSNYEFIVIDGGSSDGSVDVIKTHQERIDYWVSEPDAGIFSAMNKGIRRAKGEYCLFLNSGDFLVDNKVLEKVFLHNLIENIVVGDCNVSRNGQVVFKAVPPERVTFQTFYGRTIPHQTAFIRRDFFNQLGLYSESYRLHADIEFFVRALIVNNCTYLHLPITISDYNLEGLSSKEENNSTLKTEYDAILSNTIPPRIIADYAAWAKERHGMKALYWVKNKPLFYKPLIWLFNFASGFSKWKKRRR